MQSVPSYLLRSCLRPENGRARLILLKAITPNCRIPDDCIDSKRYPLFMARDVMRVLIEQLQAEGATPS
mgnify:CR=1 FL=1